MKTHYQLIGKEAINNNNDQRIQILEQRIEQASSTIENQNAMISNFSLIFTIIAIAIPLITALVTYLIAIRPARIAIKNFNKRTEDKINVFLKQKAANDLKQGIALLEADSINDLERGLLQLQLTSPEYYNKKQYKELIRIIRNPSNPFVKTRLLVFMIERKNKEFQKYFTDILEQGFTKQYADNCNYAFIYFADENLQADSLEIIKTFLKNTKDEDFYEALKLILTPSLGFNSIAVKYFINDRVTIDRLIKVVTQYNIIDNFYPIVNFRFEVAFPDEDFSATLFDRLFKPYSNRQF